MIKTNPLSDKSFPLEDKGESLEETDDLYREHAHEHSHSPHTHVHSEESLRRLVNRLSRIEGHIRGIKTMVQESQPCPDVLVQIAAVRGALDRVARIILDEHLSQCIARAAKAGNIEDEIEELKAALDRFLPREKKIDRSDK
jgi:DNA-binding FrmR family transcriptional regulator